MKSEAVHFNFSLFILNFQFKKKKTKNLQLIKHLSSIINENSNPMNQVCIHFTEKYTDALQKETQKANNILSLGNLRLELLNRKSPWKVTEVHKQNTFCYWLLVFTFLDLGIWDIPSTPCKDRFLLEKKPDNLRSFMTGVKISQAYLDRVNRRHNFSSLEMLTNQQSPVFFQMQGDKQLGSYSSCKPTSR